MSSALTQFMVEVTYAGTHTEAFSKCLPKQRSKINQLMDMGVVKAAGVTLDKARGWFVIKASSEEEVEAVLGGMPMSSFMKAEIQLLEYFDSNAFEKTQLILN